MTLAMKHNLSPVYLRRRKSQRGQSVIIALGVLFLLGFLGALFSIIVVRNLSSAQDQANTLSTDYFAQAGINFANAQLETSALGADWRPPLQYQYSGAAPSYIVNTSGSAYSTLPTAASVVSDPDYRWITAGFTRYNLNGGRFLLRVTYDPAAAAATASSPTAKYIEIESIGRIGTVSSNDPTTYTATPPDYRRTELVAYKPIGIVDYSRFITNKDHRSDTATLGMPSVVVGTATSPFVVTPGVYDIPAGGGPATEYPLVTTYGSTTSYTSLAGSAAGGGGGLRSNMNLRLYGENNVYLNTNVGDDWEVAGNITLDGYNAGTAASPLSYANQPAQATVFTPAAEQTGITAPLTTQDSLYPSNDTVHGFNTFSGAVRDVSTSADSYGYPRSIRRLNPPLIDSLDSATGLSRYQELAGQKELQTQQYLSTSDYQPATVYINNSSDIQTESRNFAGGSSLRDAWLNPSTSNDWEAGFYSPKGAVITFGPVPSAAKSSDLSTPYGITITRNDNQQFDSGGTSSTVIGSTLYLSYESPVAGQANPSQSAVGYLDVDQTSSVPNDVVIYASGNVRIRGLISNASDPAPKHITIVTNGIAYIDGSILKGNPNSSMAILARQYVCVNTTQFLAGAVDASNSPSILAASNGDGPTFVGSDILTENALLGPQYSGTPPTSYQLFLSSESQITSTLDYTVNNSPTQQLNVSNSQTDVVNLGGSTAPPIGSPFTLTFGKDSQAAQSVSLERAAILPADIHIEAVLYAQDDSFFVIPGQWFNSNTGDTLPNSSPLTTARPSGTSPDFPYYGQPIDMQITIDGAVAENIPADIGDQSAWNAKWGWIPRYHGNDPAVVSPHASSGVGVGTGLNITYDFNAGFPYKSGSAGSSGTYLRQDRFGRPLPFAPALPVSPDLLYSGQPPT